MRLGFTPGPGVAKLAPMTRVFSVAGLVVFAAALTALAQQPTFRAGTEIVPVLTTVTDADGRLVPFLDREHFTLLDNGRPQELTVFQNDVQPFTVVVMLDFSASMTEHLGLLRNAAEQFLMRILPHDRAQVGAFSDKIQFSGTFTNDRDALIAALGDLQFGNSTLLYDAIHASIHKLDGIEGRRVVLVFTDGEDYGSSQSHRSVLALAKERDVMIYAIGLEVEYFNGVRVVRSRPDRRLWSLAAETGGGSFELKKTDELAPTFTRVVQELHSMYMLGFTPENWDGREHRLEVRMKDPGMTARARRSYVASDSTVGDP
jgi:Ca-activated chloride channel homolog